MTCLGHSIEQDLVTVCYLGSARRYASLLDLVTVCYLDTEVPGTPSYA
jgi:hypothetical protein